MNSKPKIVAYVAALTLLCYLSARFSCPIYSDVDNYAVSQVLSGVFAKDPVCQYVNPILSYIVFGLTYLLPSADGFLLIVYLASFLSLALLFYDVLSTDSSQLEKSMKIVLIAAAWFWAGVLNANYTIQASWMIVAGMLLLRRSNSWGAKWTGTALMILGGMVRLNGALLTMPFLGLVIVMDALREGVCWSSLYKEIRKYLIPLLAFSFVALVQTIILQGRAFESATVYNNIRTLAVDYPVLDYSEIPELTSAVSRADYHLATSWVFLYDDTEMLRQFQTIAWKAGYNVYTIDPDGLRLLLQNVKYLVMDYRNKLILPLIILLTTVYVLICKRARWYSYLQVLFSWGGASLIILYFLYRGRIPARVVTATLLPCIAVTGLACFIPGRISSKGEKMQGLSGAMVWLPLIVLMAGGCVICCLTKSHRITLIGCFFAFICSGIIFLTTISKREEFHIWAKKSACLVALFLVAGYTLFALKEKSFKMPQSVLNTQVQMTEVETTDTVFYYSNVSLPKKNQLFHNGKLRPKEDLAHFIALGSWHYGQKYYHRFLTENGLTFPANDLLHRPDTYLLAEESRVSTIVESLQEHYGAGVHAVLCGDYEGIPQWRILQE